MSKRHQDQLEPTRISQHGGARRNWSFAWIAIRCIRRRAAAGDDEAALDSRRGDLSGTAVCRLRNCCRARASPTCRR